MADSRSVLEDFFESLDSGSGFLAQDIANACRDLTAILDAVAAAFPPADLFHEIPDRLESIEDLFATVSQALLFAPLNANAQRRPLHRALAAIQEFDSGLDDEVRRLPRAATVSGKQLVEMLRSRGQSEIWPRWRAMNLKPHPVDLREAVSDHMAHLILGRSALDGELMRHLSRGLLLVVDPWQALRRNLLLYLSGDGAPEAAGADEKKWWSQRVQAHRAASEQIVERYKDWAESLSSRLADGIIRRPAPVSTSTRDRCSRRRQNHLGFWARQHRAIQAFLDLEQQLARFGVNITKETMDSVSSVDVERTELSSELTAAIERLRSGAEGDGSTSFPPPGARLAAAGERLSEWRRRVCAEAREHLPATLETVRPRRTLPGIGRPWRELEPAQAFIVSTEQIGCPVFFEGLQEAEAAHRATVRAVERAREVVSFGLETAASEPDGERYVEESRRNALALLEHQAQSLPDTRAAVEEAAVRAEAAALLEGFAAIEKSHVGFLAYATGRRGREAWRQLRKLAARALRTGARHFWAAARKAYTWSLLKIGWTALPPKTAEPMTRRARLGDALEVELRVRDLPAIYRRLFRLAPVEDARFLVGRDTELAGLVEAESMWERGRGASVIVVGARGSGKTSLLNCAATSIFAGQEIVRAQFCERLTDAQAMDDFLRSLLGVAPYEEVIEGVASRRRVVILEELERTYLRVMNGFEALKRLVDVVYATSRSTLWLFSINEAAFRYLDAVTGLGRHFSYRVNAMSVTQQDLTNAILQRHNLSGLRLAFAPLPEQDPRVSRVRRMLGFEQDPQELFLSALYNQSEGIFRSAFELWQACIERVEGGVVHMRQPLAPDYRSLIEQLNTSDYFVLKAVLQHGCLTVTELMRVLEIPGEASSQLLERLQSLEILEIEKANPGLRVRPEAGRVVREALSRRNLL
jgi:hypothetical protein